MGNTLSACCEGIGRKDNDAPQKPSNTSATAVEGVQSVPKVQQTPSQGASLQQKQEPVVVASAVQTVDSAITPTAMASQPAVAAPIAAAEPARVVDPAPAAASSASVADNESAPMLLRGFQSDARHGSKAVRAVAVSASFIASVGADNCLCVVFRDGRATLRLELPATPEYGCLCICGSVVVLGMQQSQGPPGLVAGWDLSGTDSQPQPRTLQLPAKVTAMCALSASVAMVATADAVLHILQVKELQPSESITYAVTDAVVALAYWREHVVLCRQSGLVQLMTMTLRAFVLLFVLFVDLVFLIGLCLYFG